MKTNIAVTRGIVIACVFATVSSAASATERGADTIGEGAESFYSGWLPPAGLYALLYYTHYYASQFNDSHGNSSVPGFKLNADVIIPRLVYMSNFTLLGG